MTYKEIIRQVAQEQGLPVRVVDKTYKAFWRFIKDKIQELPLKDDITLEEFRKLRTNFNVPSLGKLCCTEDRFIKMKKQKDYINAKDKRSKTVIH